MQRLARLIAVGIASLLAVNAPTLAQPADPAPESAADRSTDRAGAPGRDMLRQAMQRPPAERRAFLRELLQSRLQRLERQRDGLQAALHAIDEGKPLEEIGPLVGSESFARDGRIGGPPGRQGGAPPNSDDELGPVPMPGGGPGEPPRPRQPSDSPVTAEDRAAVEEFLSSAAPQLLKMLNEIRERDPAEADARIRDSLPRLRDLLELRTSDHALYELRLADIRHGREAFEAARALVRLDRAGDEASEAQREELITTLRTSLRDQYRVRGEILAHELVKLNERIAKHRENREAVVERMMERLRGRAREWNERRMRDGDGPIMGGRGDRPRGPRDGRERGTRGGE